MRRVIRSNIIFMFITFLVLSILIIPQNDDIPLSAQEQKESEVEQQAKFYGLSKRSKLAPGVEYKRYMFSVGEKYIIAHVIEAEISNPDYKVAILKADDNTSSVEKLHSMIDDYDTTGAYLILGAVNGSFWRSYTNQPMGPTIINGEVVELKSFKTWSSAFFDKENKMYIDAFHTKCIIRTNKHIIDTAFYANRREESDGIVIYNSYVGDRVPYISPISVKRAFDEAMKDAEFKDETERRFDTIRFKKELAVMQRNNSYDFKAPKISLRYLDKPALNKEIACVVTSYKRSGSMTVPENGCILTFGSDIDKRKIPKKGEKVFLRYSSDEMDSIEFYNGLCGTPRLVRNGFASPEVMRENLRNKRFINGTLKRTAIGTNRNKNKIYLVATQGGGGDNITGATLKQLAFIMRRVGAYDALNLDGGGSTVMVINDRNVLSKNCPECSRSLSVGIGIARRKISVKSLFDKIK